MALIKLFFNKNLRLDKYYIDNKISLKNTKYKPTTKLFKEYKEFINNVCNLDWKFNNLSDRVTFLDIKI